MDEVEHIREGSSVVTVDWRRMPILLVTWRGSATENTVRSYFGHVTERCRDGKRGKLVSIVDARASDNPSASIVKVIGEEIADKHPLTDRYIIGSVVIIRSAVMRGALTAVQWALRGDTRVVAVSDYVTAFDVAHGILRRAELTPPHDTSVPLYDLG